MNYQFCDVHDEEKGHCHLCDRLGLMILNCLSTVKRLRHPHKNSRYGYSSKKRSKSKAPKKKTEDVKTKKNVATDEYDCQEPSEDSEEAQLQQEPTTNMEDEANKEANSCRMFKSFLCDFNSGDFIMRVLKGIPIFECVSYIIRD